MKKPEIKVLEIAVADVITSSETTRKDETPIV